MKVSFTFRHMDSSEELKNHALDKLSRFERYEDQTLAVHAIFSVNKFQKSVELQASGNGHTFMSSETREDMYEALDLAVDKLDRQLEREKSKRKHHKGQQGATPEMI